MGNSEVSRRSLAYSIVLDCPHGRRMRGRRESDTMEVHRLDREIGIEHTSRFLPVVRRWFGFLRDSFARELRGALLDLLAAQTDAGRSARGVEASRGLEEDAEELLVRWLEAQRLRIREELVSLLFAAGLAGCVDALEAWRRALRVNVPIPRDVDPALRTWAERHADLIFDRIDATTRKRIQEIISFRWRTDEDTLQRIEAYLDVLASTLTRAELISQTEATNAVNQGALLTNASLGASLKEWVTRGDGRVCPLCRGNEAEGIIPIEDPFPSGHHRPAGHPRCRCTVAYHILVVDF